MSCQGARRAELIAAGYALDQHLCSCSDLSIFRTRKISFLPSFLDFFSCAGWPSAYTQEGQIFIETVWCSTGSSKATVRAYTVHCASQSTVRPPKGLPARTNAPLFSKKTINKEGPLVFTIESKNPRTVRKGKIAAGRRDRRTGEGGKRWASFTLFNIAKCINHAVARSGCPSLTQTLKIKTSVERSRPERHFFTFLTSNFETLCVLLNVILWFASKFFQ